MAEQRCPRGHVVHDAEATECPTCGAMMFASGRVGEGRGGPGGVALIVIGLVLSVVAVLLLARGGRPGEPSSDGTSSLVLMLGTGLGLVGSTLWLIGCIAEGVRIGRRAG